MDTGSLRLTVTAQPTILTAFHARRLALEGDDHVSCWSVARRIACLVALGAVACSYDGSGLGSPADGGGAEAAGDGNADAPPSDAPDDLPGVDVRPESPPDVPAGCGNGLLDPGEICDDGNRADGDGCDRNCRHEGCADGTREGFTNYASFPRVAGCGPPMHFSDASSACAPGWAPCGAGGIGAAPAMPAPIFAAGYTCAWVRFLPAACAGAQWHTAPSCTGFAAIGGVDPSAGGSGSCGACPSAGYQFVTGPIFWSGSISTGPTCYRHSGLACGKPSGDSCLLACCRT